MLSSGNQVEIKWKSSGNQVEIKWKSSENQVKQGTYCESSI